MLEQEVKRKEEIKNILFILKLIALFVSAIPCFGFFFQEVNLNKIYHENYFAVVIALCIVGVILFLWMFIWEKKKTIKYYWILELSIFFLVFTFSLYISTFSNTNYKFVFIFIILAYTIEMGMKYGMTVALISSAIVLAMDLAVNKANNINFYFENDLALSAAFIIVAFTVGQYVKTEKEHVEKLRNMAIIDGLTGIYNHRHMHDILSQLTMSPKCDIQDICFVLMDIDYFKNYNDLFGHQQGDEILKQLANLVKQSIRENDTVFRYGGEEFAIIMENTNQAEGMVMAEKIRFEIQNHYFYGQEHMPNQNLTVSIGISQREAKDEDYKKIINRAGEALYKAKFLRRNCVEKYSSIFDEINDNQVVDYESKLDIVKTLICVINTRDKYTYAHAERVVNYCKVVSDYLNLNARDKAILIFGAYIHDIGKINIEKNTLITSEALTDEEWQDLKMHPQYGAEIVGNFENLKDIVPLIRQHHEKYDGTGYPDHLKGNDIQYLTRILSLADSFDAMTTDRPYKKKKTYSEALEEVKKCSGTQFDPDLTQTFVNAITNVLGTARIS